MKRILILLVLLMLTGCAAAPKSTEPVETGSVSSDGVAEGTKLGQKVPDFAVTTVEGEELFLSEILAEKKLVVLNFWFADCSWCVKEFPVLELAYSRYREDVEVLALTPYDTRDVAADFADERGLSFPVATCYESFARDFGVNGYPTSVFIDREGRISLVHTGAITDPNTFYKVFDAYTAEAYTHSTYYQISELVK